MKPTYKVYHINDFREELKKLNRAIADKDFSVETVLNSTVGLILEGGYEFHSFAPVTVGTTNTAVLIFTSTDKKVTVLVPPVESIKKIEANNPITPEIIKSTKKPKKK